MITLEREKTMTVSFMGETVEVTYSVPTAAEAETELKDSTNAKLFKRFVSKVKSAGVAGWENGVDAESVINAPGTYSLVNEVDLAIVDSAVLRPDEKN